MSVRPRILMCPPDYYGIEYEINPWMSRSRQADRELAIEQWEGLVAILTRLGVEIALLTPAAGLPDLVFTANAALVYRRRAVLSHASYTGVPRETDLEKALFACDELCGFVTACALVLPTKSLHDLKVSSVRKRMKDKAFARAVHREEIVEGAQGLGMDLEEHIAFVVDAMRAVASDLGLPPPA